MTVVKIVVEIEGLEPSLTEPESVVLPLHHLALNIFQRLIFIKIVCKGTAFL